MTAFMKPFKDDDESNPFNSERFYADVEAWFESLPEVPDNQKESLDRIISLAFSKAREKHSRRWGYKTPDRSVDVDSDASSFPSKPRPKDEPHHS